MSDASSRIRVLFAIGELGTGGSERQLLGILRELDRDRFAPQLYLVNPVGVLRAEVPDDVPVHAFGDVWEPPRFALPGAAHRARIRHFSQVLDEEQIDVVYDRTYHMTLTTSEATRRRPTPRVSVVVTDPLLDFETAPERFRSLKRRLLRRGYRMADRVLAVSEGVRTAAIDYHGLVESQIETIYNFFDVGRIDALAEAEFPAGLVWESERTHIVASGRLHVQKGFRDLLAAMKSLVDDRNRSDLLLHILGEGPLENDLRATISDLRLTNHIRLEGYQANPLPIVARADLFCLSSLYEGMPNALVEAMLCSVPVVATDCPSGPREILEAGRFGRLVAPGDPQALAEAIDDALQRVSDEAVRVAEARASIIDRFGRDATIGRLEKLLVKLARR